MRRVAFAAAAVAILAALFAWEGKSYVEFSDGVYASTAQLLNNGARLYEDTAAAQPPPLFLVGAAILSVDDSASMLRAALALCALASAALVALSVLRLTERGGVAAAAGLLSLLAPWQLREHATLLPETFAAPLLMGAALLASRERTAIEAGIVAAIAGVFKLAYLVPAAAIGVAAAARARFALSAAATFAVLVAAFALGFGAADLVDNVVTAQRETGTRPVGDVASYWGQAAWNTGPLLALAALGWVFRARSRDPELLRTLGVLTVGSAALLFTTFKDGTYVNLLVVVEPPAIALAAAGIAWLPARRALQVGAAALVLFVAVQSASFLIDPFDPGLFQRLGSDTSAHAWRTKSDEVEREAERAKLCPPGVGYAGDPWIAFVAGRPMPGNQPDTFIIRQAEIHSERLKQADFAPRCPA